MLSFESKEYRIETKKKYHKFRGINYLERVKGMSDVLVYFDPDVDGVFSGFFVVRWLMSMGIGYSWYINTNREHGWKLNLERVKGKNIIAVDFIMEAELVKSLVEEYGCNVINIDHHENGDEFIEYNTDTNFGVVINNQYAFEEGDSRYLSGGGVVFESICGVCGEFDTALHRSIVGITLLSDIRDIENPLARMYLKELYNAKCTGYIKYLIDNTIGDIDYGFGVPRMDRNYVDYKFSPALNSCFRFNKEDMVVEFVLGSGYIDLNYHKMQKELVKQIQEKIKVINYPKLRVCYFKEKDIEGYDEVLSSFVGLVASQYLDGVHSCICYMVAYDSNGKPYVKRASFRGNINGLEYRKGIMEVIHGVGHGSAFGIKELYPSKQLFYRVNEICTEVEEDSAYCKDVTMVANLAMFVNRHGKEYGEYNMYCLSQNRRLVKYIGRRIVKKQLSANYHEFDVDGVIVKCFDKNVNFDNGLILPINERGNLCMYLEENVQEVY